MKTAAKVFIILSMVFGFIAILPLVFGFMSLSNLKKAKTAAEFPMWLKICTLLFCSLIGGIILLVMKDEDYAQGHTEDTAA